MDREIEDNAKKAKIRLEDEFLMARFDNIVKNAAKDLLSVAPDDKDRIIFLQAKAACVEELKEELQDLTTAAAEQSDQFVV